MGSGADLRAGDRGRPRPETRLSTSPAPSFPLTPSAVAGVTIRVFFDWCIRTRLRSDQLNPVPKGVRGKARGLIGYAPSAPWIPSESQFADLLLYVFASMSLRNQALILVLYDGARL